MINKLETMEASIADTSTLEIELVDGRLKMWKDILITFVRVWFRPLCHRGPKSIAVSMFTILMKVDSLQMGKKCQLNRPLFFSFKYCIDRQIQCLCVCCLSVRLNSCFLWTKFQPNGCTDFYTFFSKWLLIALAQTLLKLVTLHQR